jgi:hypothetical protein
MKEASGHLQQDRRLHVLTEGHQRFAGRLGQLGSRGSSVSIVSDYGLDDRAIGVRFLAEAKDFSSMLCVQTGPGAHPASCTMGTGGPFPGAKARPGRDADHSPPSSAEVVNEQELYLLSPQAPPWRVAGLLYLWQLEVRVTTPYHWRRRRLR